MEYKIIPNRGHYEVYLDKELISSEDTYSEAEQAIEEHKHNQNSSK